MAVTQKAYGKFALHAMRGEIPWLASGGVAVKCALLANTYTPNQDTDEVWGDVSANEVEGTGYAAGGVAVALSDPAYVADGNILKCDAADAQWDELTATARYAVWYVTSETAGERYLIAYCDFGEDMAATTQLFKVAPHADGLAKATIS